MRVRSACGGIGATPRRMASLVKEIRARQGPENSKMNLRHICAAVGIAGFMVAATADATVHRVFPTNSSAIYPGGDRQGQAGRHDPCRAGDVQILRPENAQQWQYGLRIKTRQPPPDRQGRTGPGSPRLRRPPKMTLITAKVVGAGVYAAPYIDENNGCDVDVGERPDVVMRTREGAGLQRRHHQGLLHSWIHRRGISAEWHPDALGGGLRVHPERVGQ